jgi:membrane-bound lytic murein transglycosylase B
LVIPPRGDQRAYLVSDNYRAIRTYNPSHFYAIAIGKLADAIGN